ncbi:MAG: alpha-L-fucosidase, partial [Victivallales bacterium]|nr:alpha-L-fucosidase [Victivallales bacterium]
MEKNLFQCWSRLLIDNHISDLRPEYMSRFSPEAYVEAVKLAGVQSSMVYACDHNGNCYYPTRIGHFHKGCNGRDLFGETVQGLEDAGILPIAYYTVIYHNESALNHPEWSVRDINGCTHEGRYRWSCPNNPEYREYAKAQLAEVVAYPQLGGIFIDMTFWPRCCCCDSCRREYRRRTGREIPEIIDWHNPQWVEFQRWREESMADFAAILTAQVRSVRPDITVTHQFSPVLAGWWLGQNGGIAAASDYASGDFYGGRLQHRFGAKAFAAFTTKHPFEFMTSRCVTLYDHTSAKSDDELYLHALSTLANGGAYFFIDAINPDGTLNPEFYHRLHGISGKLENYRRAAAELSPVLQGNTGLWFSMISCVDESMNGTSLSAITAAGNNMSLRQSAVLDETLGCADALNRIHASWKVVVGKDERELDGLDTIVLCNVAYLSAEECARIRNFVKNGGRLLVTGKTSLFDENGRTTGNFQLADVMGVDYTGNDAAKISYISAETGCWAAFRTTPPLDTARSETRVNAYAALPDFPPRDENEYASIHSD